MQWVLCTRLVFVEGLATVIIKTSQKFEYTRTFAVCLIGFQQEKLLATNDTTCPSRVPFPSRLIHLESCDFGFLSPDAIFHLSVEQ